MNTLRWLQYRWEFSGILLLSFFVQCALALVNYEANDPHYYDVIEPLLQQFSFSHSADCRLCYHPKLYYYTCALILKPLALTEPRMAIVICQFVNVLAGIGSLYILARFIDTFEWSSQVQNMVLAFIAFNPEWTGIHTQATNDAFVILFSLLALHYLYLFLDGRSTSRSVYLFYLFALAASLSKASGLLVLLLGTIFLFYNTAAGHSSGIRAGRILLTALLTLSLAAFAGNYVSNALYGKPGVEFTSSIPKSPAPGWFEKTETLRPGVRSVADAFLTFRLKNMIAHPYQTNGFAEPYPEHRSSFWSSLYGRFYSGTFSQWPPSRADLSEGTLSLTRLLFVLGFIPALLWVWGMLSVISNGIYSLVIDARFPRAVPSTMLVVIAGAFILALMKRSYDYRDFSIMKTLFLFPALPGLMYAFGFALERAGQKLSSQRWLFSALMFLLLIIIIAWLQEDYRQFTRLWPLFIDNYSRFTSGG
jgi:hypothetical protein